jgi:thiamine kinase-like enzyme
MSVRPYNSGHINDTYIAAYDQGTTQTSYIIQRINHNVFKDPEALMNNIVRVTEHIRRKLQMENTDDVCRRVLTVIATLEGNSYHKDEDGNYWRVYNFINNAETYDVCPSLELIREGAKAFGNFQNLLSDLPGSSLHETIPDFHNAPKRFEAFKKVLQEDKHNRTPNAKKEIEFLMGHSQIYDLLGGMVQEGKIPLRVTHNDTKINNIMFDEKTAEALCVIDLDTVMPGLSLYDFGDIVRTTISNAEEDEKDLSGIIIDISRFEAIVKGYLSSAKAFLNETEIENLLLGAETIILEQAVRFLADHIAGDTYYKIHRQNHNLDRCRTQIRLFEQILQQEQKLKEIIDMYKP